MKKIVFSKKSLEDLLRLKKFIATKNKSAARKTSEVLVKSINKLKEFPRLGKPVAELPECRELVVGRYTIRYRLKDSVLQIVRIWHEREDGN